ncbi:hypothetical protein DY000_02026832 [Brassica cretica]|uniref:Uncharacterized protein n=1 Tax=Brassica cretica TaxID=69181 RepID=A0ABQ7E271_BRACR|nr:hypothetical protein DY000_02026832 [Brassica cretica]
MECYVALRAKKNRNGTVRYKSHKTQTQTSTCAATAEKKNQYPHNELLGPTVGHSADEQVEESMPIAKPVTTTGETVLQPCSSSKITLHLKRQKIHNEDSCLFCSIKSKKQKKQKETESKKEDSCCYGCEGATGNSLETIFASCGKVAL